MSVTYREYKCIFSFTRWLFSPATVNAFYITAQNLIGKNEYGDKVIARYFDGIVLRSLRLGWGSVFRFVSHALPPT